jgi:hypothetical protein
MIPSDTEISTLNGKELVNQYNALAHEFGSAQVARFATRVDGVRRTCSLAARLREREVSVATPYVVPLNKVTEPATEPAASTPYVVPTEPAASTPYVEPTGAMLHARIAKQQGKGDQGLRPDTLSAATRALLLEGLSDEDVIARLREKFDRVPGNAARHHRKVLTVRGLL